MNNSTRSIQGNRLYKTLNTVYMRTRKKQKEKYEKEKSITPKQVDAMRKTENKRCRPDPPFRPPERN
jgi:hypothetical protein